jgi:hypothetical protein
MFLIRDAQLTALQTQVDEGIVERLVPYFFKHQAAHCTWLGTAQVRTALHDGLARARRAGFHSQRSFALYIGLMFGLGSGFDRDPQVPWAGKVLASGEGEAARIERLGLFADGYFDRVNGRDNGALVKALVRVRDYDPTGVRDFTADTAKEDVAALLVSLFPEKGNELGPARLEALANDGATRAKGHDLTDMLGAVTYTTLMFMLGSSFDEDLLHPWAGSILRDHEGEKAARLRAKALAFLNEVGLRGGNHVRS